MFVLQTFIITDEDDEELREDLGEFNVGFLSFGNSPYQR